MAKTITNNVRSNDSIALLHLFEFDMYNFDGTFKETLYFTDHDIFVTNGAKEYTPISITFDALRENIMMEADSVNITIDNLTGDITGNAIGSEWRGNRASIERVIYTPPEQTISLETYEYGYGDELSTYPMINITSYAKDEYVLFEGVIDSFNANEQVLNATVTSMFANWAKPFPRRTYNQNEFTTIIDAMTTEIFWGRS